MENFTEELTHLINKHSREIDSNTPDFILAEFLVRCLASFNEATAVRDIAGTFLRISKKPQPSGTSRGR